VLPAAQQIEVGEAEPDLIAEVAGAGACGACGLLGDDDDIVPAQAPVAQELIGLEGRRGAFAGMIGAKQPANAREPFDSLAV